jgi:hypothetical protein
MSHLKWIALKISHNGISAISTQSAALSDKIKASSDDHRDFFGRSSFWAFTFIIYTHNMLASDLSWSNFGTNPAFTLYSLSLQSQDSTKYIKSVCLLYVLIYIVEILGQTFKPCKLRCFYALVLFHCEYLHLYNIFFCENLSLYYAFELFNICTNQS